MFRKTRATIYFSDTVTDDGKKFKKYDDKEIGLIFGWKPSTVVQRREEYDKNSFEDLKTKIFLQSEKVDSYESLKQENQKIKTDYKEKLIELENTQNDLKALFRGIHSVLESMAKVQSDDPKTKQLLNSL